MRYAEIFARFYGEPLALLPSKLAQIKAFLSLKARGEDVPPEEIAAIVAARRSGPASQGDIAVVPVMGVLSQRVGMMERCSGGIGCDEIAAKLDAAMKDPAVKCVVMPFDSPGGSVFGIAELAERIRSAREQKKIYGIADSMAASAGYWLMSQCSELWCAPGGQVGSIGVLCAHTDESKAEEMAGVKTTLVHAAKYKVEGNPYEPLSEEARAEMQAKVDSYYAGFVADVGRGRGVPSATVRADYGQGRMMIADDAKRAGMIDRVGTVSELLAKLGGKVVTVMDTRARAVSLED